MQFLRYRHSNISRGVVSTSSGSNEVFGDRLRSAREKRQLNQTELAKLAKLQPSAIGHFESGRRKPSFANIRALSKALNVTSDFLLGRSSSMEGAATAFRNAENLSASDRESIQLMIDTLSKRNQEKGD
ncbi:helix-turn-helix domain-containing protein [Ruegeria sp. SCP10]|uniref:helix-turn-helix domain-containing protein n=1 Tax=Ruegeria sp. SCP10 TaxID=3141377 RepID=UPI0033381693